MRCTIHRWCNSCDSVWGCSDKNPAKVNTLNSITCNFCDLRWNSPPCLIVTITRYFPWRDFIHPFQTSKSNLKEMGQNYRAFVVLYRLSFTTKVSMDTGALLARHYLYDPLRDSRTYTCIIFARFTLLRNISEECNISLSCPVCRVCGRTDTSVLLERDKSTYHVS